MKNIFGIHFHLKPLKPLKRFTKTIQIFLVVFQISKITNELDIPFAIHSFSMYFSFASRTLLLLQT